MRNYIAQVIKHERSRDNYSSFERIYVGFPSIFDSLEEAKAWVESLQNFVGWKREKPQSLVGELKRERKSFVDNTYEVVITPVVSEDAAKRRRVYLTCAGHFE